MTANTNPLDTGDWLSGNAPPDGMTPMEHAADITRKLDALDEAADAGLLLAGSVDIAHGPLINLLMRTGPLNFGRDAP
jgi:hypothetical protein